MAAGQSNGYRRSLKRTVATVGLPYGYTIAIWTSGALVMHSHRGPPPEQIVLLPLGAFAAYLVLRLATNGEQPGTSDVGSSPHVRRAQAVQFVALALAVAGAWLVGHLAGSAAWFLTGLVVTGIYLRGPMRTSRPSTPVALREWTAIPCSRWFISRGHILAGRLKPLVAAGLLTRDVAPRRPREGQPPAAP